MMTGKDSRGEVFTEACALRAVSKRDGKKF